MITCDRFNTCSAPSCPLDPNVGHTHTQDREAICFRILDGETDFPYYEAWKRVTDPAKIALKLKVSKSVP